MKNLKKLLAVLVSMAMIISTFTTIVSAKEFADVTSDSAAYEAVSILSALGIVEGKTEDTYEPDSTLLRSEAAAILIRATGNEAAAQGSTGASRFTDVAADHWALGYINCAANLGYINGMGDGTFAPDQTLKYQEFVKMLVAALGYTPMAERRGGYPTGYLVVGASQGVTNGLQVAGEADATRAVVAQLAYNALDVPVMEQTEFGTNNEGYTIFDGTGGTAKKTMASSMLGITKAKGTIIANNRTSVYGNKIDIKRNNDPQVKLAISDLYNVEYDDYWAPTVTNPDYDDMQQVVAYYGDTNADDYLGYDVIAYLYRNDNDDDEILAITPEKSKTSELVITRDIEVVSGFGEATSNKPPVFEYWEDKDNDRDTTDVDIAYDAAVIYNGTYIGNANENLTGEYGTDDSNATIEDINVAMLDADEVKFVGPSNDDYDKVFITKYQYGLVEEVNTEELMIKATDITIELEDPSTTTGAKDYTISYEGENITLEDLQENDVLNIVFEGNNDQEYDYVDIIVTRDVLEGTVTEKSTTTDNKTEFMIGDVSGVRAINENKAAEISLNDVGTFYLSINGDIVDYVAESVSGDYAFILKMGRDKTGFGANYEMKIFTSEGNIQTLALSSTNFRVVDYAADDTTTYSASSTGSSSKEDMLALYYDYMGTYNLSSEEGDLDTLKAALEKRDGAGAGDSLSDKGWANGLDGDAHITKRFVAYKLDTNGDLREISLAGTEIGSTSNHNYLSSSMKVDHDMMTIGSYDMKDNAAIFSIPLTGLEADGYVDENEVGLLSLTSLDDTEAYANTYLFDLDRNFAFGAAVFTEGVDFVDANSGLAVVDSVSTASVDGDEVTKVYFVQGGELKNLVISDISYDLEAVDGKTDIGNTSLAKGDVFMYSVNGNNEINKAQLVYDASSHRLLSDGTVKGKDLDEAAVAMGILTEVGSNRISLANKFGIENQGQASDGGVLARYMVRTTDSSTIARYEERKSSNAISILNSVSSLRASSNDGDPYAYLAIVKIMDGNAVSDVVEVQINLSNLTPDEIENLTFVINPGESTSGGGTGEDETGTGEDETGTGEDETGTGEDVTGTGEDDSTEEANPAPATPVTPVVTDDPEATDDADVIDDADATDDADVVDDADVTDDADVSNDSEADVPEAPVAE